MARRGLHFGNVRPPAKAWLIKCGDRGEWSACEVDPNPERGKRCGSGGAERGVEGIAKRCALQRTDERIVAPGALSIAIVAPLG